MEASMFAWHSTLHSRGDRDGTGIGHGGGRDACSGPQDRSSAWYGPGAKCVDTRLPFR
eukprot:CAMPEP_0168504330 /NCGR_PEP_ID=MMETSP0228-20121227/76312_1 /TAXON_ID=133427 /ORGANISM="Protoceratium reticulatum, Strain CCCM 535 (=CCMP 1889)" /LENGTH=57 /DNA_ID=CAMNT_0008521407 /DNA_START=10 /DNA_END=179 /DNA_ORIENTATION=-